MLLESQGILKNCFWQLYSTVYFTLYSNLPRVLSGVPVGRFFVLEETQELLQEVVMSPQQWLNGFLQF